MSSRAYAATLAGWGRFPVGESEVITAETAADAQQAMTDADGTIARGNGRAYGDAAIGARRTLDVTPLNRLQSFDPATGTLTVEAGVLLSDVISVFAPRGFYPPVVPGTRAVTVGGAIAADIHGKNHHRDSGFGAHVEQLTLALPGGALRTVSSRHEPELFAATVGGMGLTGTILSATLRLRRIETGWIRERTIVGPDLPATLRALDEGDAATYSVAWIDGLARGPALGRSLVYLGEHATRADVEAEVRPLFPPPGEARVAVPIDLPAFSLNRYSVGTFNEVYFRRGARRAGQAHLVPADQFFFPLDGVDGWNRIYGRRGFVQHQCVLPLESGPRVLADMLERVSARGDASFLAVLKKLGPSHGLLSFPMPGYTLALDFPASRGIVEFLHELDALVVTAGGRLYLAKDACQSRDTFEAGYPHLSTFRQVRRDVDPGTRLRSRLSERLAI